MEPGHSKITPSHTPPLTPVNNGAKSSSKEGVQPVEGKKQIPSADTDSSASLPLKKPLATYTAYGMEPHEEARAPLSDHLCHDLANRMFQQSGKVLEAFECDALIRLREDTLKLPEQTLDESTAPQDFLANTLMAWRNQQPAGKNSLMHLKHFIRRSYSEGPSLLKDAISDLLQGK